MKLRQNENLNFLQEAVWMEESSIVSIKKRKFEDFQESVCLLVASEKAKCLFLKRKITILYLKTIYKWH